MPSTRILIDPRRLRENPTSGRAAAHGHWLSGRWQCREGEAPAEPNPCRDERFIDPCCFAKTLAIACSADQRSAARQKPRPPRSSLATPAKQWDRRDILKSATATTAGLLLPAVLSQSTPHASTAAATIYASPAPLQIVDTNISLFRWPFRRLPLDDTQELCTTLHSLGVVRQLQEVSRGSFSVI
ncbi:MAG UNVERIFIED_CONTAM: hypothetical protein LVR18_27560 [Planctomycetaceae bacterium]|jgi:hypothetical protein